jgi:hypothetical protein
MGKRSAGAIPSLLWCLRSNERALPITIVGHVPHAQLLLASTPATGTLTSRSVATIGHVTHAQLLLAPTAAMGTLISADHCYCSTCGTRVVAANTHNSDNH